MAIQNTHNTMTLVAETAVELYRIVGPGTADQQCVHGVDATTPVLGVTFKDAAGVGMQVGVQHAGVAKVEAGGAIAVGDGVIAGAAGKGVSGLGPYVTGIALEAAAADGDIISVLLTRTAPAA